MSSVAEWGANSRAAAARLGEELERRLLRLDLRFLPLVPRVLVVSGWTMTVVIAWLLVLPGVVDTVALSAVGLHNGLSFLEPFWYRTVFFVAAAVIAASFAAVLTIIVVSARRHRRRASVLGALAILALAGYPVLLMAADWSRLGTIFGLAAALAAFVVALMPSILARLPSARIATVSSLTAVAWLTMIPAQLLPRLGHGWAWDGTWAAGLLFAIFGGVYAIVRIVRSRATRVRPHRRAIGFAAAAIACGAAVIVIALRMTVGLDWFGTEEREVWILLDPISWPHATIVGVLIVVLAVRSQRMPRTERAWGLVILLLVLAAAAPFVQWVIVFLRAVTSAAFGGPADLDPFITSKALLLTLKLVPLLVLAVLPWSRRSIGRIGAVVAVVYYAPSLPGHFAYEASGADVPQYITNPGQVIVVVVASSVALLMWSVLARRAIVEPRVILLLAIVPLIAVTGGLLLPSALPSEVGRVLVVGGSLAALLFSMPRVAADPLRRSRRAVTFTAFTLLVLASYATAIGQFAPYADPAQSMAVDWVALPLAAMLCCRVMREGTQAVTAKSEGIAVSVEGPSVVPDVGQPLPLEPKEGDTGAWERSVP